MIIAARILQLPYVFANNTCTYCTNITTDIESSKPNKTQRLYNLITPYVYNVEIGVDSESKSQSANNTTRDSRGKSNRYQDMVSEMDDNYSTHITNTDRRSLRDLIIGFIAGFSLILILSEVHERPSVNTNDSVHNNVPPARVQQRNLGASLQRDFLDIGRKFGTDKVGGQDRFETCNNANNCPKPEIDNPKCRVWGQYYHTIYNRWLGSYSMDDAEPFQFLEIGFFHGKGFDTFIEFLPKAEAHTIEIACIEQGPREEGKWPWGNFAENNPKYKELLEKKRLHCGDENDYTFLQKVWTTEMKRPDSPPLKVVVEDGAHIAEHMIKSFFFWFPKIAPSGLFVMEGVLPNTEANKFRTNFVPQLLKDLHYCGDPAFQEKACFPTIWPLLQSIHCELHICVFERNDQPAIEYEMELSTPPSNALDAEQCLLH